ncbi:MAG TPA: PadR family transcriptional regulator [Gemmatimonadaceae bacterium]|jgi:transcriptional regulator
MPDALPLLRGTLDLLVLRALAGRTMHGYEITSWIDDRAHGRLELLDSALYQALYRLEERRLIRATWGVTENKRRARYYELTAAGRSYLKAEAEKWNEFASTITAVLSFS